MEKLVIRNFAGIREADIEIKSFNVIIGEQRNELTKLIHFLREILINPNTVAKLFKSYFPSYNHKLDVSYKTEEAEITVWLKDNDIKVELNKPKGIRETVYIPAKRTSPIVFPSLLLEKNSKFMIIEDVDLHLFPKRHKEVVFYISKLRNMLNNLIVLTTNSPYVLSAINSLLLAGNVMNENSKDEIERLIGRDTALKFEDVGAYEIEDNEIRPFLNHENRLLGCNVIDKAAEEYEELFDNIMEIDLLFDKQEKLW